MFWTRDECQNWLPFVQAVAEGKEIEEWTGYMEKVQEGEDTQYSTEHRFTDDEGNVYASILDTEYHSYGNLLPIIRSNKTVIDPIGYLRVKENEAKGIEARKDNSLISQLTKARELLNEFVRISAACTEDFEHDYSELIGETEQFLKETK